MLGGNDMKVVIAGGTGFVGKALVNALLSEGHSVIILTRKAPASVHNNLRFVEWLNENDLSLVETELDGTNVFINLSGESINSGRWTNKRKARILKSRVNSTNEIIRIISKLKDKPKTLINASAIGFYGTSETDNFTEEHCKAGNDFLASTVLQWEEAARKAEKFGVRTVLCRFGVILAKDGGAFSKMALPYKMFVGGKIASGKQWISWIHIDDVVRALLFVIKNEHIQGPINFTSPNPVTMNEMGQRIGKVMRRPHWLPVPKFVLQILLGEMSSLVVQGQRVVPEKLDRLHYQFVYPGLEDALKNIYEKKY